MVDFYILYVSYYQCFRFLSIFYVQVFVCSVIYLAESYISPEDNTVKDEG